MTTETPTPVILTKENTALPVIAPVATAVPVFIGYTQKIVLNGNRLTHQPILIHSLMEYEQMFGLPEQTHMVIPIRNVAGKNILACDVIVAPPQYKLYYTLRLYFANGGGSCYVVSVGSYTTGNRQNMAAKTMAFEKALDMVSKKEDITIIVLPDAAAILPESSSSLADEQWDEVYQNYYGLYQKALQQCAILKNRTVIVDVLNAASNTTSSEASQHIAALREHIGENNLSYGAAYYPWLHTSLLPYLNEASQPVTGGTLPSRMHLRLNENTAGIDLSKSLYHVNNELYTEIKKSFEKNYLTLPPGGAIAGVYCQNDQNRGVWKAPANLSLQGVTGLSAQLDSYLQDDMNRTASGKSINSIREFSGRGAVVWGARTLAGNDNEWRYVAVRRFVNMLQESVKKGIAGFCFEPNDANTWTKVKGMVEEFLLRMWRSGALTGMKPNAAFFVKAGLGETMTQQDIDNGQLIVEIGVAPVRPAEFIIIRIGQKMCTG